MWVPLPPKAFIAPKVKGVGMINAVICNQSNNPRFWQAFLKLLFKATNIEIMLLVSFSKTLNLATVTPEDGWQQLP